MKQSKSITIFRGTASPEINNGKPTAHVQHQEFKSIKAVFNELFKDPIKQDYKDGDYILTASSMSVTKADKSKIKNSYKYKKHFHRNNDSVSHVQFIPVDGDKSEGDEESCIPVKDVYHAMLLSGYEFILYTTHSNTENKNRWRLLVTTDCSTENYESTCMELNQYIKDKCPDFKMASESKTLSQPWYISARKDPDDDLHFAKYKKGKPFEEVIGKSQTTSTSTTGKMSNKQMMKNIKNGTGNHEEVKSLIQQKAYDGKSKEYLKNYGNKLLNKSARKDPEHKKHSVWLGEFSELESNVNGAIRVAEKRNNSTAGSPDEMFSKFSPSQEKIDSLEIAKPLYKGLIVKGHFITLHGKGSSGKSTAIVYMCETMAKKSNLTYIDMDSPGEEISRRHEHAKEFGYKYLNPSLAGSSIKDFCETFEELSNSNFPLKGYVYIIDTVKKIAEVIQKGSSSNILKIGRNIVSKGATVILIGHVNKYHHDGSPIFEGTEDFYSDVDELIYVCSELKGDTLSVSFYPDKTSCYTELCHNTTFKCIKKSDGSREVSRLENFIDVQKEDKVKGKIVGNSKIVHAIVNELKINTCMNTDNLITSVVGKTGFAKKTTKDVLMLISDPNTAYQIIESQRVTEKNNSVIYALKEGVDIHSVISKLSGKTLPLKNEK